MRRWGRSLGGPLGAFSPAPSSAISCDLGWGPGRPVSYLRSLRSASRFGSSWGVPAPPRRFFRLVSGRTSGSLGGFWGGTSERHSLANSGDSGEVPGRFLATLHGLCYLDVACCSSLMYGLMSRRMVHSFLVVYNVF